MVYTPQITVYIQNAKRIVYLEIEVWDTAQIPRVWTKPNGLGKSNNRSKQQKKPWYHHLLTPVKEYQGFIHWKNIINRFENGGTMEKIIYATTPKSICFP